MENQKLRLPTNPLVSTLGQDVVTLDNTKENNVTIKGSLQDSAQPLSIILSSNKINVGLTNSTELNNSTVLVPYLIGTTQTPLLVNHEESSTITNRVVSVIPNTEIHTNDGTFQNKTPNSNNAEDKIAVSNNYVDAKQDLAKEPRIDILQKETVEDVDKQESEMSNLPSIPHAKDGKDKSELQLHVIPTFYNTKAQGMYSSSQNSSISTISHSKNESVTGNKTNEHGTMNISDTNRDNSLYKNASLQAQNPNSVTDKNESANSYKIPQSPVCGKLGGAAIFQVFGKLSQKLMPNMVASWVTGQSGLHAKDKIKDKRARIDLSGEFDKHGTEPRIIAGKLSFNIIMIKQIQQI